LLLPRKMAADIKRDLKASSRHFQHLLTSVPKQLVYDEDTIGKLGQEPSNTETLSLDDPAQKRQMLKEKLQNKLEQLRAKRKKEVEEVKHRRITDKEKRKKRRKMQKEKKSSENREKSAKPSETAEAKGTFNKEGNILFSKFEITDSSLVKKKNKHGLPTGKNYKMMLQKVEKQKEKLQKLETTDKDAAKASKERLLWKKVIAKAEGVKVKDDAAYLKLALKKKEKLKQKRKEGWNKRERDLQMKLKKQQDKRRENIQTKKNARQEKKIKRAQKRGRVVFND